MSLIANPNGRSPQVFGGIVAQENIVVPFANGQVLNDVPLGTAITMRLVPNTGATSCTLNGVQSASVPDRWLILKNESTTASVTVAAGAGGSQAANQFAVGVTLPPLSGAYFIWSSNLGQWFLISGPSGAAAGLSQGNETLLFTLANYVPHVSGLADVEFAPTFSGNLPGYWTITRLLARQTAGGTISAGTGPIEVWSGAGKTGSQFDCSASTSGFIGGNATSLTPLNTGVAEFGNYQVYLALESGSPVTVQVAPATPSTLYASLGSNATPWTAGATLAIFAYGIVMPF